MNSFLDLIRFDLDELRRMLDVSGCPRAEHLVNILNMLDSCFLIDEQRTWNLAMWEVVRAITTFAILMEGYAPPVGSWQPMYPARLRRISLAIEDILALSA